MAKKPSRGWIVAATKTDIYVWNVPTSVRPRKLELKEAEKCFSLDSAQVSCLDVRDGVIVIGTPKGRVITFGIDKTRKEFEVSKSGISNVRLWQQRQLRKTSQKWSEVTDLRVLICYDEETVIEASLVDGELVCRTRHTRDFSIFDARYITENTGSYLLTIGYDS